MSLRHEGTSPPGSKPSSERSTKNRKNVGRTDPPMATMMLGQTDDSFTEIEGNIRKILNAITAESYSIVKALSLATRREMLSLGF